MARILLRPKARRDINGILVYYIETAGVDVARRFRKAATESFRELAGLPMMGAPRKVAKPEFLGVRMWRVRGFESYLIFYMPHNDGIAVERVIHASQDYQRV
jgi:plasmid stabilization system protein ParE